MAKRISGITIEIEGSTKKLDSALKGVDRQLSATQRSLKDVDRLLKLDPGNTELLQQKQKLLSDSVGKTKERLDQLRKASEQAAASAKNYDAWKAKYGPIQKEISETREKLEGLKERAKEADGQLSSGKISKDRYDALQREIAETEQGLDGLRQKAADVDAEFGKPVSPEAYDALQREIVETEQDLESLTGAYKEFGSVSAQQVAAAGEDLKGLGGKVSGVGEGLTKGITAPVVAGLTAAVKTTADFDASMSKVAAVSGASGDDFDALRDKARQMGKETKFSASDAADAFNYMAMAGWKTDQMLGGIGGIMNLAAASGEDLASTSDIVTDALTAFGMQAEDSGELADILAAAASNANTDVSMMGESFKYAAPVVGAMFQNEEDASEGARDAAVAIGLMGNAGIKASSAGTSLRTMLTNMANPTESMAGAMDTLGVSLDDGEGRMNSLRTVMEQLREGFGGLLMPADEFEEAMAQLDADFEAGTMSEKEYGDAQEALMERAYGAEGALKAQAAASLAGKTGMSGLLAIVNASQGDWDKLTAAIDGSAGTAEEMAAVMQDNLLGQLTILGSQLADLAVQVGDMVMPYIRDAVSAIQGAVDWLDSLDEGTKKVIVTVALVAAAVGPLLVAVGNVMTAVGQVMTYAPKISSALSAAKGAVSGLFGALAANPLAIVAAAVAGLVAAFVYFWNTSEKFRDFWKGLWAGLKEAFGAFADFFAGAWEGAKEALSSFAEAAGAAWEAVKQGVADFAQSVGEAWDGFVQAASGVWETVTNAVQVGIMAVGAVIEAAATIITLPFQFIWENCKDIFTGAWEAISGAASEAWGAIAGTASEIWGGVSQFFSGVWDGISKAASEAWGAVTKTLTGAWESISKAASEAWGAVTKTVSGAWESISGTAKTAWDGITKTLSGAWEKVKGGAKAAFEAVRKDAGDAWQKVKEGASPALSAVQGKMEAIRQAFSSKMEAARQAVSSAVERIKGLFNFSWSLPQIKLPHFSIDGKFSLDPPSVPHLKVEWYRKAYDDAYILSRPTIFGASGGRLLGGGEGRGSEAVVGTEKLASMMREAVSGMGGDITIPVYIGTERLDTLVVKAAQRSNYRSGGR